ncbi:MAG: BON domain-containing protein [Betaproteobacteria bacterium]
MKSHYQLQDTDPAGGGYRRPVGFGSLIGSAGAGAILMYFMDPQRGRRRRALVRDQMVHIAQRVRDARRVTTADLANRSSGLWASTRRWLRRDRAASDRDITERVRARLGRVVSHPHAVEVAVHQGHVTLSGPILLDEVQPLVSTVKSVEGVRSVEDRLSAYAEAGGVSALQGGRPRRGRFEFFQRNWSPAARLTGGVVAAGLLLCAARGRGAYSAILGVLGGGLLLRAATNRELTDLRGALPRRRHAAASAAAAAATASGSAAQGGEAGMALPPTSEVSQNTPV